MSFDLMFSMHSNYEDHNTKERGDTGCSSEEFLSFMKNYPQFVNIKDTYYRELEYYKDVLKWDNKTIDKFVTNAPKTGFSEFILGYDDIKARKSNNLHERSYTHIGWNKGIYASIIGKVEFQIIKLFYEMAKSLNLNLLSYDGIITEAYLETLRINEENRGIKLTKAQRKVLDTIEDQCRWFYVPKEDVQAVFPNLDIQPDLKEAHLTEIIDDVQFENKIVVASFIGHTILFGLNAPYIAYPNLNAYMDAKDQHTPHLQNTLNKLSKTFGTAAYFEYNNDDEMIASLAWSSKGKFVYGRFTSEGEGIEIFGTQKKPMEVNQKTLLKTAKKLGMTPGDILTGIMKQNQKVQYFTQCDWNIESKLKH